MHNSLLPKKENIVPIDHEFFFRDNDFKGDFERLSFEKKLRIVNDLVRQTILPSTRPEPETHRKTGIGNCHTASLIAIEYLKSLGIGKNHRYVMARIKPFEPDDVLTKHSLVLLEDDNGITYQFDATPFVGYKYGSIAQINNERFYKEYIVIDKSISYLLDKIFDLLVSDKKGLISDNNIDYYNSVFFESSKYEVLNGYTYSCSKALSKYQRNEHDKKTIQEVALRVNKYHHLASDYEKKKNYREYLLFKQLKEWEEELNTLVIENRDYKRQLELIQMITQEKVFYDEYYEKKIILDGEEVHLSHMTPRFFYERNLHARLNREGKCSYSLSEFSIDTGIEVRKFTRILKDVKTISLGNEGLNPIESSFVYLTGFPEHQIMTQYMYPNKVLMQTKKD